MRTYAKCIEWLFEQFPAYQQVGQSAYKPDLDNIIDLCEQLDIDYPALQYIHVAGTNGKGSTCNMLASVFIEKKYKTGLFTSPHIKDFRERITVNGHQIPEERVIDFCNTIQNINLNVKPSFFEITWALALTYFIESGCEICIIETGLGGRLDATNIITPVLSIITNISLDHTNILGNTIAQIAFEKAGIIKEKIPIVIGTASEAAAIVFKNKAEASHAPLIFSENTTQLGVFLHPEGTYQWINERTVRTAIQTLNQNGFNILPEETDAGIQNTHQNTGFRGRFEIIQKNPLTIVDVAHNVDGINAMLATLEKVKQGKLHIVYGTSADKDLKSIVELFPTDAIFHFTEFSNQRSAKIADLKKIAKELGLTADYFTKMDDAVKSAQLSANKYDTILITGSFFLISDFFNFFSRKSLVNPQK